MFDKKTVVIVGAGGSVDFGLPSGAEVYTNLLNENLNVDIPNYNSERDLFTGGFAKFLLADHETGLFNQLDNFINAVKEDSYADSIDLFASSYPEFTEISKLYSTWSIHSKIYEKKHPGYVSHGHPQGYDPSYLSPKNIWHREPIPSQGVKKPIKNWMSALLRKHLEDVNETSGNFKNNLKIVTFNYDTILEDFFSESIKKIPKFKDMANQLIPEIFHVYGSFNKPKERPSSYSIIQQAKEISYMNDISPKQKENLLLIREVMLEAECIFIVGFDAARQNSERIELEKSKAWKYALNYNDDAGLNNRLRDIGVPSDKIMTGKTSIPWSQSFFQQADGMAKPALVASRLRREGDNKPSLN